MKLVIAAISAGGVLGVADQYMCLLIVSLLSKMGMITLSSEMDKVFGSWWFIGIVAFFWLLTTIPAYASLHLARYKREFLPMIFAALGKDPQIALAFLVHISFID